MALQILDSSLTKGGIILEDEASFEFTSAPSLSDYSNSFELNVVELNGNNN